MATASLAAVMMLGVIALPAQAALQHIDGTVVSKDASSRTFRIATQSGNKVRIKVTSSTRFERIAGFGALRSGLAVEVDARRTDNGLVATQVEPQGGGGGGGGAAGDHGGGGSDDGPNHT
ncbi:MAG TPA: DUF5666 domain-containing protein [Solirubrobacterales bacterium]|nr:DUF5666 domain-containing protein [Solirubrobacterales bacterium]